LYAPGASCRAAGSRETNAVVGVVPLLGVALSQLPPDEVLAAKVNITAPGPVSDRVLDAGRVVAGWVKEKATFGGALVTRPPVLASVKTAGVPTPAAVALTW